MPTIELTDSELKAVINAVFQEELRSIVPGAGDSQSNEYWDLRRLRNKLEVYEVD